MSISHFGRVGVIVMAFMALMAMSATAGFAQESTSYTGDLTEINDSGASARVEMTLEGTSLDVKITGSGFTASAPHAQHIHGVIGSASQCPTADADADGDGLITTAEGVPSYGGVLQALTTEGDTSGDSALAVDRFPVASEDGSIDYQRTFELPEDVAGDLGNLHVAMHGIDLNGDGEYNGDAVSSLDPSLPLEATIPAACGTLAAMPAGGVATGAGGTADGMNTMPSTAVMLLSLVGLVGAGAAIRRVKA